MLLTGITSSESYNVYNQINQIKVWESLLGCSIRLNAKIVNSLRHDTTPGCWLYEYNNIILLADFADTRYHGITCVDAVMLKYNCSYTKALEMIKKDFSYTKSMPTFNTKESSWNFRLLFNKGNWNIHHKNYWSEYDITKHQLESENCYPVSSYSYNSKYCPHFLQTVRTYDETTAIVVDGRVKIYRPNSLFRFLSNFTEHTIGGTNTITDTVIITKSIKDYMVLDNLGYSSRFIHSETSNPDLSAFKNYKRVYVLMDNDETGKKACETLSSINNFIGITIPDGYPKDISDYYKIYGNTESKHLIRQLIPKGSSQFISSAI